MGFNLPGMELFSKPNETKIQNKSFNAMNKQMQGFQLGKGQKWNFNQHMQPYYTQAQGGIQDAYSTGIAGANNAWQGALSGLQGSEAYGNLMAGSGLNRQSFEQYLKETGRGSALQEEELARIAALDRGGWSTSDPNALAEIAPEVNAAGATLDEQIRAAEASGVRGGSLAAMKYAASRDKGTAVGNALQQAILNNRGTKNQIAMAKFGFQPAAYRDASAEAAAGMLSGLYGGQAGSIAGLYGAGAGALSGLHSGMFNTASGAEIGNLDRNSDLFKYLMQQSNENSRAAADRAARERQNTMSGISNVISAGISDARLKTPPGEVRGALSDLRKLPVYDYRYNDLAREHGGPESGTPGRGVMAQDLEKIPSMKHLVHKDPEGFRSVDVYGLAATTMRAVQELDKKLDRIARMKAPKSLSRMRFAER